MKSIIQQPGSPCSSLLSSSPLYYNQWLHMSGEAFTGHTGSSLQACRPVAMTGRRTGQQVGALGIGHFCVNCVLFRYLILVWCFFLLSIRTDDNKKKIRAGGILPESTSELMQSIHAPNKDAALWQRATQLVKSKLYCFVATLCRR